MSVPLHLHAPIRNCISSDFYWFLSVSLLNGFFKPDSIESHQSPAPSLPLTPPLLLPFPQTYRQKRNTRRRRRNRNQTLFRKEKCSETLRISFIKPVHMNNDGHKIKIILITASEIRVNGLMQAQLDQPTLKYSLINCNRQKSPAVINNKEIIMIWIQPLLLSLLPFFVPFFYYLCFIVLFSLSLSLFLLVFFYRTLKHLRSKWIARNRDSDADISFLFRSLSLSRSIPVSILSFFSLPSLLPSFYCKESAGQVML